MKRLGFGICLVIGIWRLGFSEIFVYQTGDTLKFFNNDSLVSIQILKNSEYTEGNGYYIKKAKVSPDNKRYIIYEEKNFPQQDSIFTKLTLFDAGQNKIWSKEVSGQHKILFELCKVYPDRIILFTVEKTNTSPQMLIIKNDKNKKRIDLRQWTSVVNYAFSPDGRYVLFHAKKPYNNKLWDYIYFLDLETNKTWEYLFPFCFSCKRGYLDLKVDNEGKSEVIYRNEHRIFSKDGQLIDVFVKLD